MGLDPAPLNETLRYQITALKLTYQETLVILYRPFLLDDLDHTKHNQNRTTPDRHESEFNNLAEQSRENTHYCLQAATSITHILDSMSHRPPTFSASWFAHFCGYQAVVALYVYVIKSQSPNRQTQTGTGTGTGTQTWLPYFEAASKCQDQIKVSAKKDKESFSQKCSGVLEELRMEALASIKKNGQMGQQYDQRSGDTRTERRGEEASNVEDWQKDRPRQRTSDVRGSAARGGERGERGSRSFFSGSWNDMTFDQSAPGGGILGSLFGGVDGIRIRSPSDSVVDRIDRWGFSSLNW